MTKTQTYGLAGTLLGIVLLGAAYYEMHEPIDQLLVAHTGKVLNGTIWLLGLGAVGVLGVVLASTFAMQQVAREAQPGND